MRATAFDPPPPTPTTLMRAPLRLSSCSSYFRPSKSPLSSAIADSFRLPQDLRQQSFGLAFQLSLHLQFRGVHGQAGGRGPRRVVDLRRPVLDAHCEAVARLAFENALGHIAHGAQPRAAAG